MTIHLNYCSIKLLTRKILITAQSHIDVTKSCGVTGNESSPRFVSDDQWGAF